ncbi:MAG: hypothetical protein EAX95_07630 [Candidatus Thorarchaeota archaeon]|nr:hypothetical protein [Candidatus Thorarchaeota archaeon]
MARQNHGAHIFQSEAQSFQQSKGMLNDEQIDLRSKLGILAIFAEAFLCKQSMESPGSDNDTSL